MKRKVIRVLLILIGIVFIIAQIKVRAVSMPSENTYVPDDCVGHSTVPKMLELLCYLCLFIIFIINLIIDIKMIEFDKKKKSLKETINKTTKKYFITAIILLIVLIIIVVFKSKRIYNYENEKILFFEELIKGLIQKISIFLALFIPEFFLLDLYKNDKKNSNWYPVLKYGTIIISLGMFGFMIKEIFF